MSNILSELMHHLDTDRSMKLGHAPKDVQIWLEELSLPLDLLRFLQWNWPQVDTQIGHISVMSSENILKGEETMALIAYRFLALGSAPNGDFFVLDISTDQCRPGFITHEEYWEHEENPRKVFQPIARSLASLLYRFAEGRYVPTDYYAAKDFSAFLEAENRGSEPDAVGNEGHHGAD
jgi:hypothetical protein